MKRPHEENEDSWESDEEFEKPAKILKRTEIMVCPYLGTVNRDRLDFDFEKVCSVSLARNNIYSCLVCGKNFQGRGRNSHANIHSLQLDHHVFLNLASKKFYCLPDDYEIVDSSLEDIKDVLDPQFSKHYVSTLDKTAVTSRTLEGLQHSAGIIGINNVKNNDHVNVTLQALGHLSILRDFFLISENNQVIQKSELTNRFAIFLRKMWAPRLFRNHISPHEILQEISNRSKFKIGTRVDLVQFISWFLNSLHNDLTGGKKNRSSIIRDCFQGEVLIATEKDERVQIGADDDDSEPKKYKTKHVKKSKNHPFLYLTLECPPPPLFKDIKDKNFIPQEPLFTLLSKFDGETKQYSAAEKEYKTYKITKLPKYLILAYNRFTSNFFITEKNRTIVTFPMKGLDMLPYTNLPENTTECTKYNLIANFRHNEGETVKEGYFNVHILQKANEKWYDIQDLIIDEAEPPLIALSESFIQIYERQDIFDSQQ